jgi:hypothetical protein
MTAKLEGADLPAYSKEWATMWLREINPIANRNLVEELDHRVTKFAVEARRDERERFCKNAAILTDLIYDEIDNNGEWMSSRDAAIAKVEAAIRARSEGT